MKLVNKELLNNTFIKWYGRTYYDDTNKLNWIYNPVSGFIIKVSGGNFSVKVKATNYDNDVLVPYIQIVIDQDFKNTYKFKLDKEYNDISINLDENIHYVELYKQSEAIKNHLGIEEINANLMPLDYKFSHVCEVIGDSTTAGYGNLGRSEEGYSTTNTDALQDFAFLSLKHFNSEVHTFTASGWGVYASIWTNPKTTNVCEYKDKVCVLSDIPYDYKLINPELIMISLGTNDGTYLREDKLLTEERTKEFVKKYTEFIMYKLSEYPKAKILMIYGSIKETLMYDNIIKVYEEAHKLSNNVYKLEVHGDTLGANGHPSLKAHYNVSDEIIKYIKEIMNW